MHGRCRLMACIGNHRIPFTKLKWLDGCHLKESFEMDEYVSGEKMFLEKISIYDCQVWRLGLLRLMLCQVWRALFNGLQSSIFPVIVRQFRTVRISPGNPENTPTLPLMDSLVNFTTLHSWPPLVNGNKVLLPIKNPFKTPYIVTEVPSVVLEVTKR